jgi:hypothetical protein
MNFDKKLTETLLDLYKRIKAETYRRKNANLIRQGKVSNGFQESVRKPFR